MTEWIIATIARKKYDDFVPVANNDDDLVSVSLNLSMKLWIFLVLSFKSKQCHTMLCYAMPNRPRYHKIENRLEAS